MATSYKLLTVDLPVRLFLSGLPAPLESFLFVQRISIFARRSFTFGQIYRSFNFARRSSILVRRSIERVCSSSFSTQQRRIYTENNRICTEQLHFHGETIHLCGEAVARTGHRKLRMICCCSSLGYTSIASQISCIKTLSKVAPLV